MRIEYYHVGNCGYGVIFKQWIDTASDDYVSHTDDEVVIRETYLDVYDNEVTSNVTYHRNFITMRNELLATNRLKIDQLTKTVEVLQSCDNYDAYDKKRLTLA
jgi:hypothetical protein